MAKAQESDGEAAGKFDRDHARPPLKAGRRAFSAVRALARESGKGGADEFDAVWSEAVGVARRDAVFCGDPLGFEQGVFGQAHEDRVERAGLEAGFTAEFVAVAPGSRTLDEAFEDAKSLRG